MRGRLALALLSLTGCFKYSPVPTERPAPEVRKLSDAQIVDMKLDLKDQTGLCPGQKGKLYAKATVVWPNSEPVKRNIGNDVDSLAPSSFAVKGALLTGDKEAHLHPSGDVLASVETGFQATIVYTPIPKFTFNETFPPEYTCFRGWWDNGAGGGGGNHGDYGGDSQEYGGQGGKGGNATPGNPGSRGGRVTAYVTFVSTKFFPKLIAVIANDRFFLAPATVPLTFGAVGGGGGEGGTGGAGGAGGNQATETREEWNPDSKQKENVVYGVGSGGRGGDGGNGARGGKGGDGGTVDVVFDSKFPELRDLILVDVNGGSGGNAGGGGAGGAGGQGNGDKNQQPGGGGGAGGDAEGGAPAGRSGRATVNAGSVQNKFSSMRGLTIYRGGR